VVTEVVVVVAEVDLLQEVVLEEAQEAALAVIAAEEAEAVEDSATVVEVDEAEEERLGAVLGEVVVDLAQRAVSELSSSLTDTQVFS